MSGYDFYRFWTNEVIHLYTAASVKTAYEAMTVFFHIFMLESGFIPKGINENAKFWSMPENWNGKGVYKIFYSHSYCPSLMCCMSCIPLYQNMSVQGTLSKTDCPQCTNIKIEMKNYMKRKTFSGAMEDFTNLNELSRCFKDGFCLPLLNMLCETAGCSYLFGLPGMVDEIKIYLLKYLPVEDVVSMSAVNKKFNDLANLPELWKYMFLRDFSRDGVPDVNVSSTFTDWKQKYKQEYMKKKRNRHEHAFSIYPYILDPDYTNFYTEFPHILDSYDPSSPYVFPPMLPPRLPPFFRRLI